MSFITVFADQVDLHLFISYGQPGKFAKQENYDVYHLSRSQAYTRTSSYGIKNQATKDRGEYVRSE